VLKGLGGTAIGLPLLDVFPPRGIRFSEATLRKYVQLGLLPRSVRVGQKGKPEAYYFPPQYNFKGNNFPYTFMGLEPGTTKDQVRKDIDDWYAAQRW